MKSFFFFFFASGAIFLSIFNLASADEFKSTSFTSSEPVIFSGSYGTSTSFALIGSISQVAIGTSTATSFGVNSGFLYFPSVTSPIVSATAGDTQADLSWTNSVGSLGWTVSGYNVGQSTTSGGPYAYTTVGNVNSSTRTGLTNGTTYYFVIRAEDAFGNSIATSSEVSATPAGTTPTPTPTPSPTPGGGGGGGPTPSPTPTASAPSSTKQIIIKGLSSPFADITIFKDGTIIATTVANGQGAWQATINISSGVYNFSVYSTDLLTRRTLTTSLSVNVNVNQTGVTTISDIIVPPTIIADKSAVKSGNFIIFSGQTYPNSAVNITINSNTTIVDKTKSDSKGLWSYKLDSSLLEKGDHSIKTQVVTADGLTSIFSESLSFRVGDTDIFIGKAAAPVSPQCSKKGDINKDGKINIVDLSILLFFWNQRQPANTCADVNRDGRADIIDFSIMLFWWTG